MTSTSEPVPKRMGDREFVIFLAVVGVTISVAIDTILPAFDEMKVSLGLDPGSNSISLTVTVYFIAMSSGQLVYGPLADRFGRKAMLYAGLLIYLVGAGASMLAPTLAVLLVGRAVWGFGAAALRVMSNTIVRDRYQGDRMARVLSLVMTVFLLGPIIAPLIGEAILTFASWRIVLGACVAVAAITAVWTTRLEETLDPANRRPLEFAETRRAFSVVFQNRLALAYSFTVLFTFAILASFLASSQLVFDEIFGRADQFAVLFSLLSVGSVVMAYMNSVFVLRLGSERVIRWAGYGLIASSGALTAIAVIGDGAPGFWVWFAMTTIMISLVPVVVPTGTALSMAPLGDIAGTAAGVLGTIAIGGGAILGAALDSIISDSVLPMSVGSLLFAICSTISTRWAQHGPQ